MESKIACAIVSTSASWDSLSVDLIVTVSSRIVQFLSFENSARIRPPAVGAQEPFSTRAMVRFWRLWLTMSWTRFSMFTNMPALYVVERKTRWLARKHSETISLACVAETS